jgi:hypothetical protein
VLAEGHRGVSVLARTRGSRRVGRPPAGPAREQPPGARHAPGLDERVVGVVEPPRTRVDLAAQGAQLPVAAEPAQARGEGAIGVQRGAVRARQRVEGGVVGAVLDRFEIAGERSAQLAADRRDPGAFEDEAQHGG